MAKSNLEDDIFKVLKQRGIELNTNVENIFRFTGNNNARTLANFNCATGVQEIEECVRSTLGKKERHVKIQKRTATFGEWFTDDPCDFIFSLVNARQFCLLLTWRRQLLQSIISGSESLFRWTFYFIFIYTPPNTEHTAGSSNATGSHTSIPGSSGSTQVNFTARDCFVTRFARVDAHIALTAKGVKDGLNFPRFTRSFEDTRSHPRFTMPGIEQINDVLLKARNDAENALATLGLRAKGKDKFDFPQDLSQQLNSTNAKKKKIVPSTAGKVEETPMISNGYFPCKYYVCSVPMPILDEEKSLPLSESSTDQLNLFLNLLEK
ncbi:hypothetical protein DAPPUDRAFT_106771 [Daphnia pulex]|uniref:Uncharacterized protein n=1 Tax=Daphnia pulex TaxID=6669 RepID=E9GUV9_DAPPU|nr:hypothetical protein DAPPUDRAFT_106771 [Daphnia pulex]|eukprot:EFX76724.1 hypothetical protein DAPPUDRAFT_106771 [Daphnia pulex]